MIVVGCAQPPPIRPSCQYPTPPTLPPNPPPHPLADPPPPPPQVLTDSWGGIASGAVVVAPPGLNTPPDLTKGTTGQVGCLLHALSPSLIIMIVGNVVWNSKGWLS